MVTITSGAARLLGSGSAITFGGEPLRLCWTDDGERTVTVELAFVTDSEQNGPSLQTELQEGEVPRLVCVNFEPHYGRGTAMPLAIATLGDDVVLLHFRALRYGQSPDWLVHWSLYAVPRSDLV